MFSFLSLLINFFFCFLNQSGDEWVRWTREEKTLQTIVIFLQMDLLFKWGSNFYEVTYINWTDLNFLQTKLVVLELI